MPELPQMQALAERLDAIIGGHTLEAYEPIGFSGLKTFDPPPDVLVGQTLRHVGRRGKYLVASFERGQRLLVHLSQAGRIDIEEPPKQTRGQGKKGGRGVVRLRFDGGVAIFLREHGTERKAAWWVLGPDDDGPLAKLGPEPDSDEFAEWVLGGSDKRRIHTWLRDQRTVVGVGRGYADDALWRACLSPYATLPPLDADQRERLLVAVRAVLTDGLERERQRTGGLSEPKLGGNFDVHRRAGEPCPRCESEMRRVSYESYEITYCPTCQTGGKILADRRLSRLLK